jgi:glutaconate CoA-transferase, subunit B
MRNATEYTLEELLVVNIARTINDGEVGFTGLATGGPAALYITNIPLAAMELARRTHAPNLTVLFCGWSHNPDIRHLTKLPNGEFENELLNLPCEAQMSDYPGPWSHKRGDVDFGFGAGVQVDIEGNINSVRIGSAKLPKVRLVGPILLPEHMALFGREYIMMPHHGRRNFVEKVDHISGVGYPGGVEGRKELGLERGGPEYVYTPKCIFAFDKGKGRIRVESIHPGITAEDLRQNTGFDLGPLDNVPNTAEPTSEEIEILRNDIDPCGLLLPKV